MQARPYLRAGWYTARGFSNIKQFFQYSSAQNFRARTQGALPGLRCRSLISCQLKPSHSAKTLGLTASTSIDTRRPKLTMESSTFVAQPQKPKQQSLQDGSLQLLYEAGAVVTADNQSSTVLDALHKNAYVNTEVSKQGGLVLGVSSSAGPTSLFDVKIGQLNVNRMLACSRCKLWWMTPEWRSSTFDLPPETQFLLCEVEENGPYAIVLPLIDGDFRATLRPIKKGDGVDGELILRLESGSDSVTAERWDAALYVAASWDPYELVDRGVAAAAALSGGAKPRTQKQLPASLDSFGWCTWDAFYSTVSARGLQEGLASLNAGGINPRLLIIDDGWQMTEVDLDARRAMTAELADQMHIAGAPRRLLDKTQEDFFEKEQEVLADASHFIPPGSSAGVLMPTLTNMGATHHSHTSLVTIDAKPDKPETAMGAVNANDAIFIVRVYQKLAGMLMGLATAAFLMFYQWVVEPAPPNSLAVRWFASAAQGFLRPTMLSFYATASDFTRRLTSVKANGKFSHPDAGADTPWEGMPEGLHTVVSHIKTKFGIKHIYCWHGLPGYWAGVMPNAIDVMQQSTVLHAKPTPGVLDIEPSMAWNPAVLGGIGVVPDPRGLYNAMHSYLASAGIDGVKVDCQAGVGLIGSALGGGAALSNAFQAALEASIKDNFSGNQCINCMCHSTENLYRMTSTVVARASDDFYPRDPASSHPHIASCAYNSLFLSAVLQPDWDMFHSKHSASSLHAMARAISGGPVYVSDKPGEHDFNLLHQLVLPDGSILRARQPGRPTRDCLFADVMRDKKTLLKVWTVNSCSGVVGVFHLQGSSWDRTRRKFYVHEKRPTPLATEVRPIDVEPYRNRGQGAEQYAVHSFSTGKLMAVQPTEAVKVTLKSGESDMLVVAPIITVDHVSFAAIGLTNMMNTGGSIMSVSHSSGQPMLSSASGQSTARLGRKLLAFELNVKGVGELLMYSSQAPAQVLLNGTVCESSWVEAEKKLVVAVPKVSDLLSEVKVLYDV